MHLEEKIHLIVEKFQSLKENITTEEATKNAFIMPFIQDILGYEVFNPLEVVPEFIADAGSKKGEKVDYCIKKEGEPILIIECKHWKENLDNHVDQLTRYYTFTNARFGILTNGIEYRFYTDLDNDNKMDELPFLSFNLSKINEFELAELKRFRKENFNEDDISKASQRFKNLNEVKAIIKQDLDEPSEDLITYYSKKLKKSLRKKNEKENFSHTVKKALNSFINEEINHRLKLALDNHSEEIEEKEIPETTEEEVDGFIYSDEEKGIYTTKEEVEGFEIIKDILSESVDLEKIHYRDTKSYFGVLFDDNNRKPVCRLYFNNLNNKRIAILDQDKNEIKYPIKKLEHIYKFSNDIIKTALSYIDEA